MAVLWIVANIATPDPGMARAFYEELLGLKLAMDFGWILTFVSEERRLQPQVSVMSEGGSGTPAPDLSIEVDNVDDMHARTLEAGFEVIYTESSTNLGACGAPSCAIRSARSSTSCRTDADDFDSSARRH